MEHYVPDVNPAGIRPPPKSLFLFIELGHARTGRRCPETNRALQTGKSPSLVHSLSADGAFISHRPSIYARLKLHDPKNV
jgi:hypothetical protein